MAAYDDLTQQQKNSIALLEVWARGTMSSLVTFADQADFNVKQAYYEGQVQPLIQSLDAGEVIPNTSGLGGSVDITKEKLNAVLNWLFGIQADIDTNLPVVVELIGINADR